MHVVMIVAEPVDPRCNLTADADAPASGQDWARLGNRECRSDIGGIGGWNVPKAAGLKNAAFCWEPSLHKEGTPV
jgi:hypothetical protein